MIADLRDKPSNDKTDRLLFAFAQRHKIRLNCVRSCSNPTVEIPPEHSRHWFCRLRNATHRSMSFYWTSIHRSYSEPTLIDVLRHLTIETSLRAMSFDEFCSHYLGNRPKRFQRPIYKRYTFTAKRFMRFLGPDAYAELKTFRI